MPPPTLNSPPQDFAATWPVRGGVRIGSPVHRADLSPPMPAPSPIASPRCGGPSPMSVSGATTPARSFGCSPPYAFGGAAAQAQGGCSPPWWLPDRLVSQIARQQEHRVSSPECMPPSSRRVRGVYCDSTPSPNTQCETVAPIRILRSTPPVTTPRHGTSSLARPGQTPSPRLPVHSVSVAPVRLSRGGSSPPTPFLIRPSVAPGTEMDDGSPVHRGEVAPPIARKSVGARPRRSVAQTRGVWGRSAAAARANAQWIVYDAADQPSVAEAQPEGARRTRFAEIIDVADDDAMVTDDSSPPLAPSP